VTRLVNKTPFSTRQNGGGTAPSLTSSVDKVVGSLITTVQSWVADGRRDLFEFANRDVGVVGGHALSQLAGRNSQARFIERISDEAA
jgi:hypothetical protein